MVPQCSICLSQFKDPVCLPCGHLYCKNCLTEHVNVPSNRGLTSTCPDCRTTFNLVVPDLAYLPQKYHPFISHAVRRVYIDLTPDSSLQKKLKSAEARLASKMKHEEMLMKQCEGLSAAVHAHRSGEREANERVEDLEERLHEVEADFQEHLAITRARMGDVEQEHVALRRDNYDLVGRLQELEASLAASETRRRALERGAYVRHPDSDESDVSLSSPPPRSGSRLPYKSQSKGWDPELENSRTESSSASRVIKPLPRRMRVTRGRDDDSVVVCNTKRARMRG